MPHYRTATATALALALIPVGALRARADIGLEGIPHFDHIVVLVLENEDASDTFDPSSPAVYLKGLRAEGTFLPQYYGTSHVSLGNYITMMSGLPANPATTSDCLTTNLYGCVQTVTAESPVTGHVHLGDQLDDADGDPTWAGYMDLDQRTIDADGDRGGHCFHASYDPTGPVPDPYQGDSQNAPGYDYADRHNPWIYFKNVIEDDARCLDHVHPYSQLAADLAANTLPSFSFITPDTCHDGHDSPCSTKPDATDDRRGGLYSADSWLQQEVPALLDYLRSHNGLLIITFDEGNPGSANPEVCTACASGGLGGRTGTVLVGAGVPAGVVVSTPYDHASLLRTLEDSFGIAEHLGLASNANATPMTDVFAWVTVVGPGNPDLDPNNDNCGPGSNQPCGAVAGVFQIGKYEVTNSQYTAFLNAVAATDTYALYNPSMGSGLGGITRTGTSGSYIYAAIAGRENLPVNWVSWYDALRFANWRQNGQPSGSQDSASTEDGAYTFAGTTSVGARNPGAKFVVPTEDEWYKAAYFDPISSSWFDYPAASDAATTCSAPTAAPNAANCGSAQSDLTNRGAYSGSASPSGTFDQGGNVWEWNEADVTGEGPLRGLRGGSFDFGVTTLAASNRGAADPQAEDANIGFRLPEPGRDLMLIAGALALAWCRRRRR